MNIRKTARVCVGAPLVLVGIFGMAAAQPGLAQGSPCDDAQNTHDMYRCALEELALADGALNQTYSTIQNHVLANSPTRKAALQTAQRAWISLRDLDCHSEGLAFEGGSFQKVLVTFCLGRKTRERTAELQQQYVGTHSAN